jgi:hypothetical protein
MHGLLHETSWREEKKELAVDRSLNDMLNLFLGTPTSIDRDFTLVGSREEKKELAASASDLDRYIKKSVPNV